MTAVLAAMPVAVAQAKPTSNPGTCTSGEKGTTVCTQTFSGSEVQYRTFDQYCYDADGNVIGTDYGVEGTYVYDYDLVTTYKGKRELGHSYVIRTSEFHYDLADRYCRNPY
jgi:hypothetical protein